MNMMRSRLKSIIYCFITYPDNDGLTRKVRIAVADDSVDDKGRPTRPVAYLDRPIQKLILLLPADLSEDREIPIEEPDK